MADPASARIAVTSSALADRALDEVVALLRDAGVPGVELTLGPGGHLGLEAVAPRTGGVVLCGVALTGALPLGAADLGRAIACARRLEAGFVRVFAPAFCDGVPAGTQLAQTAAALAAAVETAGGALRVLVEMAPGTVVPSPELALRVLEGVDRPAAGVVYDPASLLCEGHLQPPYAIDLLAGRIGHVHVKNQLLVLRDGRAEVQRTRLREGLVDWPHTVRCLAACGYDGWYAIDHLSGPVGDGRLAGDVGDLRQLVGTRWAAPV
jgi:sugar phosphate isomerase/epimerase